MDSYEGSDKGVFAGFQPHPVPRIAITGSLLIGVSLHTLEACLVHSNHNSDMGEVKYDQVANLWDGCLWQHHGCVGALP